MLDFLKDFTSLRFWLQLLFFKTWMRESLKRMLKIISLWKIVAISTTFESMGAVEGHPTAYTPHPERRNLVLVVPGLQHFHPFVDGELVWELPGKGKTQTCSATAHSKSIVELQEHYHHSIMEWSNVLPFSQTTRIASTFTLHQLSLWSGVMLRSFTNWRRFSNEVPCMR